MIERWPPERAGAADRTHEETKEALKMEMNFDVKAGVEELVRKIQRDPALLQSFQKDPLKTVEKVLGLNLPDEKLQPLVTGVKAKLAAADIGDKLGDLKKLF